MKKVVLLAAVLVFVTTITQAQITKGRTLLGGTVAYNQSTGYNADNTSYPGKQHNLFVNPSVGNAIKENLVLGVEASFYTGNLKYGAAPNQYKNKSRSYGGSVFLRQYVPLLKRFYFYAQAAAGGNKNKSWQTYNAKTYSNTEGWGAGVSFTPGLTYALTKKLYAESGLNGFALLNYNHSKTESTDLNTGTVSSSKGSNFNFSTSLGGGSGLNIGFRLLL